MSRTCKDCGNEIAGRSDKQFCGDACRSNYHNKRLAKERQTVYGINSILRRNRKVLVECTQASILQSSREDLLKKGFDFSYYTHFKKLNGKETFYCYDLGYQERGGSYTLINDQETT